MKFKRLFALTLACAMTAMFASCGRSDPPSGSQTESVNTSGTTVLNVSNYAGGYGSEWLAAVKARFEKEYAETSFESGKKSVYIQMTTQRATASLSSERTLRLPTPTFSSTNLSITISLSRRVTRSTLPRL